MNNSRHNSNNFHHNSADATNNFSNQSMNAPAKHIVIAKIRRAWLETIDLVSFVEQSAPEFLTDAVEALEESLTAMELAADFNANRFALASALQRVARKIEGVSTDLEFSGKQELVDYAMEIERFLMSATGTVLRVRSASNLCANCGERPSEGMYCSECSMVVRSSSLTLDNDLVQTIDLGFAIA